MVVHILDASLRSRHVLMAHEAQSKALLIMSNELLALHAALVVRQSSCVVFGGGGHIVKNPNKRQRERADTQHTPWSRQRRLSILIFSYQLTRYSSSIFSANCFISSSLYSFLHIILHFAVSLTA